MATDFEGTPPFSFACDELAAQPVPGSDMKPLRHLQRLQQHLRSPKCVPAPALAFEASYDFPLACNVMLTFGNGTLGLLDGSDRHLSVFRSFIRRQGKNPKRRGTCAWGLRTAAVSGDYVAASAQSKARAVSLNHRDRGLTLQEGRLEFGLQ
jgi:hypothetical protein